MKTEQRLDRFFAGSPKPLRLAFVGWVIAAIGAALAFGIDFGRGVFRRPLSDDEIVRIITNGIPNTPMPPTPNMSAEQATQIVAYLRAALL